MVITPKYDPLATSQSPFPPHFPHIRCLSPTGCLAKAWCLYATTSTGTNRGESWIWPSAGGECGYRSRTLGRRVFIGGGLIQSERTEERGHHLSERVRGGLASGPEAERGPCVVCACCSLSDNMPGDVGVPGPRTSLGSDLTNPHLGFYYMYYSFPFWITIFK